IRRSVLNDTEYLLHGGEPCLHLVPSVLAQRRHATLDCGSAQLGARLPRRDRVLHRVGDEEELEQTETSAEAGAATGWTSGAASQRRAPHRPPGERRDLSCIRRVR